MCNIGFSTSTPINFVSNGVQIQASGNNVLTSDDFEGNVVLNAGTNITLNCLPGSLNIPNLPNTVQLEVLGYNVGTGLVTYQTATSGVTGTIFNTVITPDGASSPNPPTISINCFYEIVPGSNFVTISFPQFQFTSVGTNPVSVFNFGTFPLLLNPATQQILSCSLGIAPSENVPTTLIVTGGVSPSVNLEVLTPIPASSSFKWGGCSITYSLNH